MSVRTPEGFVRKSKWQVADVRRPLVSASHITQARNDLFIGKDEVCIMNRRKKKSVLRKRMCTCLICFQAQAHGIRCINQVADGRELRKRVTFDCNNPTF